MNDTGAVVLELLGTVSLLLLTLVLVAQVSALVTLRALVNRAADAAARVAAVEGVQSPYVAEVARATLAGRVEQGDVRIHTTDRGGEIDVTVTAEPPASLVLVGVVGATATRTDERDVAP
ncbi:MAG: hypothetical protein IT198_12280 [Acidimicrobiia bacterium]|nr:hypothetical protein [Acidimicrobiia bacterium]